MLLHEQHRAAPSSWATRRSTGIMRSTITGATPRATSHRRAGTVTGARPTASICCCATEHAGLAAQAFLQLGQEFQKLCLRQAAAGARGWRCSRTVSPKNNARPSAARYARSREAVRGPAGGVFVGEAIEGLNESGDRRQRRRLAGAVGPNSAAHLRVHAERQIGAPRVCEYPPTANGPPARRSHQQWPCRSRSRRSGRSPDQAVRRRPAAATTTGAGGGGGAYTGMRARWLPGGLGRLGPSTSSPPVAPEGAKAVPSRFHKEIGAISHPYEALMTLELDTLSCEQHVGRRSDWEPPRVSKSQPDRSAASERPHDRDRVDRRRLWMLAGSPARPVDAADAVRAADARPRPPPRAATDVGTSSRTPAASPGSPCSPSLTSRATRFPSTARCT